MKAHNRSEYARAGSALSISTFLFIFWTAPAAWAALDPSQVLVLENQDTPISSQVGRMYEKLREIPAANVLSLSLGTERQITPEQYWAKAAPFIKLYLDANPQIRCILTTSGVPYTIQATDGKDDGASFDSELAAILREQPGDRKRRRRRRLCHRLPEWCR